MLVDQNEIDGLLSQASTLATEAAVEAEAPNAPPAPPPALGPPESPDLQRLLRIRVPVIVQLASRPMPVGSICKFATGSIIEFHKSVDEDLSLLINNHPIGWGTCVKIGEHFGIRLTRIDDRTSRIRSMGP